MSTSKVPSSCNCFKFTKRPLIWQRLLPFALICLERITTSDGSNTSLNAKSVCHIGCVSSGTTLASTFAKSAPSRTISAEALSPNTSPIDLRITDLPAPVSPVKIFNPGASSKSSSSMRAMLRIESVSIIIVVGCQLSVVRGIVVS